MRVLFVGAAVAATLVLPSTVRGAEPLRSGTIVGGLITTGGSHECGLLPDCLVWLAAECDPALAGHDPAWLTSIVDVADLAVDQRTRVFEYESYFATAYLQFWTDGCTEIDGSRVDSSAPRFWTRKELKIPASARWMTVSGNSGLKLEWTLS